MTTIQTIKEAESELDKKLPQLISNLVWTVTDGGRRIQPNAFLSYQEEPVKEYESIKSEFTQTLLAVFESELEKINGMGFVNPAEAGQFAMHTDGYNQAIEDICFHLTEVINYLKQK